MLAKFPADTVAFRSSDVGVERGGAACPTPLRSLQVHRSLQLAPKASVTSFLAVSGFLAMSTRASLTLVVICVYHSAPLLPGSQIQYSDSFLNSWEGKLEGKWFHSGQMMTY